MANIFNQQRGVNNHPKRNNFDLSFQNHATFKFGKLYPVFCKEVVPGDSFRIKSAFGLKFMPMVFPVQSKMRACMHFFYVRNKNLWNRWEDWISGLKGSADGVEFPFIDANSSVFKTGSLLDYFNVPTTISNNNSTRILFDFNRTGYGYNNRGELEILAEPRASVPAGVDYLGIVPRPNPVVVNFLDDLSGNIGSSYDDFTTPILSQQRRSFAYLSDRTYTLDGLTRFDFLLSYVFSGGVDISESLNSINPSYIVLFKKNDLGEFLWFKSYGLNFVDSSGFWDSRITDFLDSGEYKIALLNILDVPRVYTDDFYSFPYVAGTFSFPSESGNISDAVNTPFASGVTNGIRLSALPFRGYESIVNVFYRNSVIDPFMIDGRPEYNKFVSTDEGGADSITPLSLFERNYEFDFLTSALPSPQQGIAPLVGFSALGEITVSDVDGNPINAQYELEEDGSFTGKVSIHNPAASNTAKQYLSRAGMALAGLSINDFRNVNALQRWLETNIRKGYRYKDFIEGHFGKSPKYNELDMPEFIGGYSRDVQVSQIVQSADMGVIDEKAGTLGSFAGMASCFGGSKHDITHYCDDYGFIIGIMCVIPTPSYSQLLPKMFLKNSPLDYYFPEFSQLGMQPITYEEVTPLTAYNYNLEHEGNEKPLTDTFGYQRPNYDLVASVDEVHGQFRTTLRDFLIQRYFDVRPELGKDFIKIKNEDASSVFSIQSPAEDNILGQIIFQVYAKRPIPRVVIPSLGR